MSECNVAEAKDKLPSLINNALEGEEVVITRRGEPVVELRPALPRPKALVGSDEWLCARRRTRPKVNITAVELLNQMYESDDESAPTSTPAYSCRG